MHITMTLASESIEATVHLDARSLHQLSDGESTAFPTAASSRYAGARYVE